MPVPIRQSDMEALFALTDALGIHREALTVPLLKRDPGEVRALPRGQFMVTLPESIPTAEWVESVARAELARLGYEELP